MLVVVTATVTTPLSSNVKVKGHKSLLFAEEVGVTLSEVVLGQFVIQQVPVAPAALA